MTSPVVKKRARIVSIFTTWTLRILLTVTILFFVALGFITMMGGNGDIQRESLNKVFSDVIGQKTEIGRLNTYELFPQMKINLEELVSKGSSGEPLLVLQKLQYAHDAIQHATGDHSIVSFRIDNLITAPGFIGPYSLHVTEMGVSEDGTNIVGHGNYGGYDFKVKNPVIKTGTGLSARYTVQPDQPFILSFPDFTISFIVAIESKRIVLKDFIITSGQEKYSGTLIISKENTPAPVTFVIGDEKTSVEGVLKKFSAAIEIELIKHQGNSEDIARMIRPLIDMILTPKQKDEQGNTLKAADITVSNLAKGTCILKNSELKNVGKNSAFKRCFD